MKIFIILFSFLFVTNVGAKDKKAQHREHEAHVHGGGTLSIAFDGNNGKIEFKAAAEAIVGFEHEARSEKDKKMVSDAITKFESEMAKMVKFDSTLNCHFTKEKVEIVKDKDHSEGKEQKKEEHGTHSDFVANFTVVCSKAVVGTKLTIDFGVFLRLKDLDVTVLAGELQKSGEFKGKPVTIDLK